jgi:hypothetical protein
MPGTAPIYFGSFAKHRSVATEHRRAVYIKAFCAPLLNY